MIILEINKLFHEVIGLQSFQRSKYGGNIQIVVPFFVTVSLFGVASTSFVHFLLNVDDKILIALPSLQTVFAFPMIVLIYWYFLKFRADFYSLFDDIQAIIDERMKLYGNCMLYAQTQQRVQFLAKMCTTIIVIPIVSIAPFVRVAYHLCIGNYSIDSWFLFLPIWIPFEFNAAYYALMALIEFFSCVFASLVAHIIVCSFIEVSLYAKTIVADIKSMFDRLNDLAKSKSTEISMLACCKEAVELHARLHQCMNRFASVTHFIILVVVAPVSLSVCASLLVLEKYATTSSLLDLQVPILGTSFGLPLLFIFFYFGQKLHSDLIGLSDMIYQSEWYRYPRSVRRCMLLMLIRAQRPFYLSAYGVMRCTLENYVRVLNWIYSVFMVFRCID